MIREVFSIGSFAISPFGVMMVVAFVVAYFQIRRGLRREGIGDDEDASALVFTAGFGGIIGAKLYYAALYGDWRLIFDRSGLVWYGGFILATLALVWMIRHRGLPLWRTLDVLSLALAVGYGVGRIGCFLVGDDYGMPTDLPWGVAFPHGLPAPTTAYEMRRYGADIPPEVPGYELVPVHPTQLYETLAALAVWGLAAAYLRRRPHAGKTFLLVVGLLAAERFAVEFLRAKDDRFFGPLTLAQVLSMAVILAAAAAWAWRSRRAAAAAAGG